MFVAEKMLLLLVISLTAKEVALNCMRRYGDVVAVFCDAKYGKPSIKA